MSLHTVRGLSQQRHTVVRTETQLARGRMRCVRCDPDSMTRLLKLTRGAKSAPQFSPSVYTSALSSAASRPSSVLKALVWASQQGSIKNVPTKWPEQNHQLVGSPPRPEGYGRRLHRRVRRCQRQFRYTRLSQVRRDSKRKRRTCERR